MFLGGGDVVHMSKRVSAMTAQSLAEVIEKQVDHGCCVKSEHLAEDEASADGDAKWTPQL